MKCMVEVVVFYVDVVVWDMIVEGFVLDGILGDMLGEVLGLFNDWLVQFVLDVEWLCIVVGLDMSIMIVEQSWFYYLFSELEKWCVDVVFVEVISYLLGLKLLVLDCFDLLDLKGCDDLFVWLNILVDGKEIDIVLVLGMLKLLFVGLLVMVVGYWIEGGMVGEMKVVV